jgi:subtilisin family serine protease
VGPVGGTHIAVPLPGGPRGANSLEWGPMSGFTRHGFAARTIGGLSFTALLAAWALPGVSTASAASGATQATRITAAGAKPAIAFPLAHRLPAGTPLDPSILSGASALTGLPTHGTVTVMLELDATNPVTLLAQRGLKAGSVAGIAQVRAQRAQVDSLARSVSADLSRPATAATALFTLHNVYSGIAVRTDASRLGALAALPGVKAIHPMPAKHLLNATTVPLINAPAAWGSGVGAGSDIGTGTTIGIIDTGIDYTHADFGGTGTVAAYKADHAVDDSATLNVPTHDYPSAKVAGGYDFVGDAYDDTSDNPAIATPHGDPNPLDCDGHGTHVAGTAAGLGVTSAGATYPGPWSSSTPFGSLKIGPGVAPGAKLYALRVFGCTGDTNVVSKALDWAADPNGDGNFSDHLDVVNMSLGTDYAAPDDPDAIAADALSLLGTTVVAAAGNGGDLQDVAGSPGAGSRVISAAASQDSTTVYDALQVDAPPAVAGNVAGQENSAYPWATSAPVSAAVAGLDPAFDPSNPASYSDGSLATTNADGCNPFTAAQKALVAGKIAWLEWTDDDATRRCGSADRSGFAAAAGAVGVVLADDQDNFAAGILGVAGVPTFEIRKTDAATLRPDLNATLHITLTHALHGSQKVTDPGLTDVIASFSSRGITDPGNLKPDVTAPGSTVFSALVGSGADGTTDSGTSMASPHVAGSAALVKAMHPAWTPEQIKAALVDTAVHDVWSDPAHSVREAPDRVGSGRIDAGAAVATQVLAYSADNPGSVAVSYGAKSYTKNTTVTKTVRLTNDGAAPATYALGFDWANAGTHPGGVGYSYPATVTIPAHGTTTVPVVMTITVAALTHTLDSAHNVTFGDLTGNYLTEASGWLTLTPAAGGQNLRLTVFAAPRPASTMKAAGPLAFGHGTTAKLALTGGGVRQDGGNYQSLVSGYELQLTSPKKPACTAKLTNPAKCVAIASDRAGDLKYVGVASDAPLYTNPAAGLTYFAISTFGDWRTPVSYAEYDVYIDTNGDGKADAILFNDRISGTDVFASILVNPKTGDVIDDSVFPLNNADGSVDTNVFDNDVLVLPVATAALTTMSAKAKSGNIHYWVAAGTIESGMTDVTGKASFNVLKPGLTVVNGPAPTGVAALAFAGEQFFADLGKGWHAPALTVLREPSYASQKAKGLLLVHPYNLPGDRVQVLPVTKTATKTHSVATSKAKKPVVGSWVVVTATVTPARTGIGLPQGTVTFYDNGHMLTQRLVDRFGVARLATNTLTKGTHIIGARYSGNASDWLTSKATVKVVIH